MALGSTDTIGIVSYANGTSGQVKFSGVYVDNELATPGTYYCQSNGTIGTTVTKVFVGTVTSPGRLVLPGGGGSITPATPTSLGGVMAGVGLAITPEGLLSTASYPAWFTDRGDGSDGDYAPTASTTLGSGAYNFKSVNIPAGVTITLTGCVEIKCLGAFTCVGIITANGINGLNDTTDTSGALSGGGGCNGYMSNRGGDSNSDVVGNPGGSGYGAGGVGGAGGAANGLNRSAGGSISSNLPGVSNLEARKNYILADKSFIYGGGGAGGANGGGSGGGGGASIYITAHSVNVLGAITANGGKGGNGYNSGTTGSRSGGGGGGGGGAVVIVADTISNTGTISANGGIGGTQTNNSSYAGAAGSAGIVFLKELGAA